MSNPKSILLKQIQQIQGIEGCEIVIVEPYLDDYMLCHVYFDPKTVVDRLTPDEVALRNYNATVKRNLINDKTTIEDFVCKLHEESEELWESSNSGKCTIDPSELADISIVCDSMAIHYGIDLQAEKEAKMYKNETRLD